MGWWVALVFAALSWLVVELMGRPPPPPPPAVDAGATRARPTPAFRRE